MNLTALRTEADLEKEGVFVRFDDIEFRIASTNTSAYKRAVSRHTKSIPQHKVRHDPSLVDMPLAEAFADTVLLGWKGELKDGERVLDPMVREDRLTVLKIPQIREWIAGQAGDLGNFQKAEDAAEVDALKSRPGVE